MEKYTSDQQVQSNHTNHSKILYISSYLCVTHTHIMKEMFMFFFLSLFFLHFQRCENNFVKMNALHYKICRQLFNQHQTFSHRPRYMFIIVCNKLLLNVILFGFSSSSISFRIMGYIQIYKIISISLTVWATIILNWSEFINYAVDKILW